MDIIQLLEFSVQQTASDLHISSGMPPVIRISGDIRRVNSPTLDGETNALSNSAKIRH
ncbi:hypothetical protein P8S54_06860 [Thiomicrospira sp. R3]|uniref:hypothetical protein n=1 Tax=Thiomicrospira sp. R3 TaxID=3035472 RepID=UPI00259BD050|nr:hypothetical protein [Thiomicrospira sp. R3]WFE67947.1 hypothetical protein P8S54_06860 [Thiomicrospira sp. R3]